MVVLLLALVAGAVIAAEPAPALGRPLDADTLRGLPRTVFPDGRGLPAGSGGVAAGAELYAAQCAACHGPGGIGGTADELAGGRMPLDSDWPDKTVGTYWPWATTVFDFIRRSMPLYAPGSLSADQAYALTAWLLFRNGIVAEDTVLDAASLAAVRMPNRDGFIQVWPEDH